MNRKGQLVSLEIILALVVFLALFTGMYFFFSFLFTDYVLTNDQIERDSAFEQAYSHLSQTQGYPHNWDILNLSVTAPRYIGVQKGDGTVSAEKVLYLADQNDTFYTTLKNSFGFYDEDTEISLRLYYFDGSTFSENTTQQFGFIPVTYSHRYVRDYFFSMSGDAYFYRMEVFYE